MKTVELPTGGTVKRLTLGERMVLEVGSTFLQEFSALLRNGGRSPYPSVMEARKARHFPEAHPGDGT